MVSYDVAYSLFAFKGEKVNVVGYQSGKLVVSGKNMEDFVRDILEPEITGEALLGYEEVHNPEWFTLHAGADESGKGDLLVPWSQLVSWRMVTWCASGLNSVWLIVKS